MVDSNRGGSSADFQPTTVRAEAPGEKDSHRKQRMHDWTHKHALAGASREGLALIQEINRLAAASSACSRDALPDIKLET